MNATVRRCELDVGPQVPAQETQNRLLIVAQIDASLRRSALQAPQRPDPGTGVGINLAAQGVAGVGGRVTKREHSVKNAE